MAEEKREPAKPPPAKPGEGAKPAEAPKGGGSQAAAKAELIKRGGDRRDGERRDTKKTPLTPSERALARLSWGVMVLAIAVLLLVVVGAGLVGWQAKSMRAQSEQTLAAARQTEQTLTTATHIAEAVKKSADAIPETQRAYIFLDAAQTVLPKTVAAASPVRIGFKNYGKTPATVSGVIGRYYYTPNPPVRMVLAQASVPVANAVAEGGTVGPFDIALDANDQDLARAAHGDGTLVVQAVVGYVDLFGEAHETGLCYEFVVKTGAFAPCGNAALTYHD